MLSTSSSDVQQVKGIIHRSLEDLRRHDEEKFLEPFALESTFTIGGRRFSGREALRGLFRWYHATYLVCDPNERHMDVSTSGDGAMVKSQVWFGVRTRHPEADYGLEVRCDYRLHKSEMGWRIAEQSMRMLPGQTFRRHGPLNFLRLVQRGAKLEPSAMPAAA